MLQSADVDCPGLMLPGPGALASRVAVLGCAAVLMASCAGSSTHQSTSSHRQLVATQDLRIDGERQQFDRINWLLIDHDDGIVVPQGYRVRFFDSTGHATGEYGRKGSGPGEDLGIGGGSWRGDTLQIADPGNARILFIDPDRLHSHTERAGPLDTALTDISLALVSKPNIRFGDGSWLSIVFGLRTGQSPTWASAVSDRHDVLYVYVGPHRKTIRVVAEYHPPSCYHVLPTACQVFAVDFSADNGRMVVTNLVDQSKSVASYRVTDLSTRGDTIFSREYAVPAVPVTEEYANRILASMRSDNGRGGLPQFDVPATFPPVLRILAGRDSTTWLNVPVGDSSEWHELDARGDVVGRLAFPHDVRLQVAQRDRLWATVADTNGVESIVRYRLSVNQ
jgi:hypothetical protein